MSLGMSILLIAIIFIIAVSIPLGMRLFQYSYVKRRYIEAKDKEIQQLNELLEKYEAEGKDSECLQIKMQIMHLETDKKTWKTLAWHIPRGYI